MVWKLGQPDPMWLCIKLNIAEPRFEVSKIIGIHMVKGNNTKYFLLELVYVLYDFMYLALIELFSSQFHISECVSMCEKRKHRRHSPHQDLPINVMQ
jgi:hypothetical protein